MPDKEFDPKDREQVSDLVGRIEKTARGDESATITLSKKECTAIAALIGALLGYWKENSPSA